MNVHKSYRPLPERLVRRSRYGAGQSRRQGQALLMAVLLMVFAALLGSTFVTVVALNLNQTTRQQDSGSALAATQAGLLFANKRLVESVRGENWRPEQESPPPAPGDGGYNLYFNAFDQAQGWARSQPHAFFNDTVPGWPVAGDWNHDGKFDSVSDDWGKLEYFKTTNGERIFVKFPDPRLPTSTSTPIYLLEVKSIDAADTSLVANARVKESQDKIGKLRITVIGEANDNPGVFVRRVSYKATNSSGGPLAWFRYVSNWSTTKNHVVETRLIAPALNGASQIAVNDISGITLGRQFVIHQPGVNKDTGVQVNKITPIAGGYQLTIFPAISGVPAPGQYAIGSPVRAAATLMGTLQSSGDPNPIFDADADSASPNADSTSSFYERTLPAFGNQVRTADIGVSDGLYLNGGAWMPQKSLLAVPSVTTPTVNVAGGVDKSGIFNFQSGATVTPLITNPPSAQLNDDPDQRSNGTSPRVKPLTPPSIDDKSSRYLELTKYADSSAGSPYGFGPGLYIDNTDDVERVTAATTGAFRALDTPELRRLWQRKSFPIRTGEPGNITYTGTNDPIIATGTQAYRLAFPRPADTYTYPLPTPLPAGPQYSLEERGIRGWVSPSEYRPRGVLIDLNQDTITITRDDRSDASGTAADPAKAWHDPAGTVLAAYDMTINTSHLPSGVPATGNNTRNIGGTNYGGTGYPNGPAFNGVIFAEGNIRIRGKAGSQDLTIVSMGNIYIEGDLIRNGVAATDGRIALIAKKNVVFNPTRLIARLNGDTQEPVRGLDTTLFPNSNQQTKETFYRVGAQAAPAALQPSVASPFVRDLHFDAGASIAGSYYLSLQHAGEMRTAFTINLANGNPPNSSVTSKNDASADGVIDNTEKKLIGTQTGSNFTKDLLNFSGSGTPDDTTETLDKLSQEPEFTSAITAKWKLTLDTSTDAAWGPIKDVAARRIAKLQFPNIENAAGDLPVPLTVSTGLFWLPGQTTAPVVLATAPNVSIGSSFQSLRTASEVPATVNESFYWRPDNNPANNVTTVQRLQASLNWANYRLDTLGALVTGNNLVQFQNDPLTPNLPPYRVGMMRLERGSGANPPFQVGAFAATGSATAEQAIDVRIQATVYAQDGSWFVIPAPLAAPVDTNFNGTTTDADELAATTHYRRPNYRVSFLGSIGENYTPSAEQDFDVEPDPDGNTAGAMRQWLDALAYPTAVENDSTPPANGGPYPRGKDWATITYTADIAPATAKLYLPVSPDISFTG